MNKKMKLLLIVREPVERMVSHLVHVSGNLTWEKMLDKFLSNGSDPESSINEEARSIAFSNYYEYVWVCVNTDNFYFHVM